MAREYKVFDTSRGLTNQTVKYTAGDDIITVRASSIKQAYYLAANRVFADSPKDVGITSITNSQKAPEYFAPWL